MKIGFFGNANNYPFMLARAIRKSGHEVLFIVTNRERLDRPENRYDDVPYPYPNWIHDLSPFDVRECVFPTPKRNRIVGLLKSCDAVVLNQCGPALWQHVRRPSAVLLTGSDLEYYGDFKTVDALVQDVRRRLVFLRQLLRRCIYNGLVSAQRTGIRSAKAISYFPRGMIPSGDALLHEIGVQNSQRVFFLMTDLEKIKPEPLPNRQPVRVFCGARLTWKMPIALGTFELDYKGSDIMIRGLGLFIRTTGIPLDIRLVKKGRHVAETIQLITEEGLGGFITWLDEMSQIDFWEECKQADIVFDQFANSVVGMAALDAMAIGRPVIANGRSEVDGSLTGSRSPICQASTAEEICVQLQRLVPDAMEREQVGRESRQYAQDAFSSTRAANIVLERLKQ